MLPGEFAEPRITSLDSMLSYIRAHLRPTVPFDCTSNYHSLNHVEGGSITVTNAIPVWMESFPFAMALLSFPLSYTTTQLVSWLALREYRCELASNPTLHWSEKAQLSLGARKAATTLVFISPFALGFGALATVGELSLFSKTAVSWSSGFGGFFGAYVSMRNTARFLGSPSSTLLRDLRAFAFFAQGLITVVAIFVAGRAFGNFMITPQLSSLLVAACALPWAWPPLILWCFRGIGAVHSNPQLEQQLAPILEQAATRPKHVWVVRSMVANAAAYPIQKVIVVTERLCKILEPQELSAIVAHELGHLAEGRKAWTRYLSVLFLGLAGFASAFVPPDSYLPFAAGVMLGSFAIRLGLQKWSRKREQEADAAAVAQTSPETYARALEKIYSANLFPAVHRGGNHPSLYDRMETAGISPDFPRPLPPPRRIPFALFLAVLGFVAWPTIWPSVFQNLAQHRPAALAVTTHDAWPLGELALGAQKRGDLTLAAELYRRAEQLDANSPWYPRNLMAVLDEAGECDEARAAAARSYAKAENDPEIYESLSSAVRCDDQLRLNPAGD